MSCLGKENLEFIGLLSALQFFIIGEIIKTNIAGVLALCIICGWTFRPLPFREVDEDELADETQNGKKPEVATIEESAALLTSERRSSPAEIIREAKSLTDVSPTDEEKPAARRRRCDTVGERDAGYLNRKDVFYTGSITNVAEFKERPDKYR
ncbi:hypothetical protein ANCCAN_11522 [Ancylostoma caninum]|uniref:Uncharacterized protein n=1 Tax=Ancylostoma caninum TaxID=29170 RepID=A0A368GFN9_ANCCA|nr:hypothetical protein ANCCAN_11522 [Ancylostoma caninum]